MIRAWAAPGLVVLLLAGCGPTSSASSPGPLPTKGPYSFKAGQTYRYHVNLVMSGSVTAGSSLATVPKSNDSEDVTWKVVSVNSNGNATIDLTLSNQTPGHTAANHHRFQVSPAGEFVSGDSTRIGSMVASGLVHWTSGQGFGPPGTNQFLATLPGHAVKPGDTWTQTVTRVGPYGQGSVTYTSQNHFLRYENLPSGRAAVIQTRTTVPLDDNVDLQTYAGTGGAAGPTPAPIGAPGSGMVRIQAAYTTSTTTWFEVQSGQVARWTTVFASDQTTTFSAFTGPAPPGVQTDVNGQPVSPIHQVGKLTLRLDLLPAKS